MWDAEDKRNYMRGYMKKYKPYKYKYVEVILRMGKDDDLNDYLESLDNKSAYIRSLIRKDMEEHDRKRARAKAEKLR